MSKRRSTRIALLTAAGVVSAGAIGLAAVPASAGTPTVTFNGGCSLLGSKSNPDRESLSTRKTSVIDKTAEVNVVNDLNTSATPYVDGRPAKQTNGETVVISKGGSATLPFRSGPAELILVPNCGLLGLDTSLSKKYGDVSVSVLEAPQKKSAPKGGEDSGQSGSDGAVSDRPDAGSRPGEKAPKEPVARGAVPPEAAKDDVRVGPDDGDQGTEGDDAGAPVADGSGSGKSDRKESSVALVPTNHNRGSGTMTLTLVAVICLLGVAVAALRTIVVGRTARMSSV